MCWELGEMRAEVEVKHEVKLFCRWLGCYIDVMWRTFEWELEWYFCDFDDRALISMWCWDVFAWVWEPLDVISRWSWREVEVILMWLGFYLDVMCRCDDLEVILSCFRKVEVMFMGSWRGFLCIVVLIDAMWSWFRCDFDDILKSFGGGLMLIWTMVWRKEEMN